MRSWLCAGLFVSAALLASGGAAASVGGSVPFSRQNFYKELRESGDVAGTGEDTLEAFNRRMFEFNKFTVDKIIAPSAQALDEWLPASVKTAGHNVYSNLVEPEFIVTNLMADNPEQAALSAQRFLINSTVGLAGIFDPATELGLHRREVEFTEGLCSAGISPGSYIVLPLIGPTNVTSSGLVAGFFAVEWWLLSWVSPIVATADLVIDLSASAASLRYARDLPSDGVDDPYLAQRDDYHAYIRKGCAVPGRPPQTALAR